MLKKCITLYDTNGKINNQNKGGIIHDDLIWLLKPPIFINAILP